MDNRTEDHLIDKMRIIWIGIYDAPEFLYVDGEGGLTTHNVEALLKRSGCTLKVRARGQHPRHVDWRSALLRAAMHTAEQQLNRK